jgi:hypothetical protein
MYTVDDRDRVVELTDVPQSSVGAPCPVVVASEHELIIAYFLQEIPSDWDGTTVRVVGVDSTGEPAATVRFVSPHATFECIAEGYTSDLTSGSLRDVAARACQKLR